MAFKKRKPKKEKEKEKKKKRKYRSSTLQLQDRHTPKIEKGLAYRYLSLKTLLSRSACTFIVALLISNHWIIGSKPLATRSKRFGRRATLHERSATSDLARKPCLFQDAKRRTGGVDV